MCFPWALARLLPSAVRVRIRSRSTSARPPSTGAPSSARCWCRCRPMVPPRIGIAPWRLDDGEQVEGAAREAVNPRHRHHVAGGAEARAGRIERRSPSRGRCSGCCIRPREGAQVAGHSPLYLEKHCRCRPRIRYSCLGFCWDADRSASTANDP